MINRHYHVIDEDITSTNQSETFDLITCISVLEHIEEPEDAIRNMVSFLEPHGYLILTFPSNERNYVRNMYELPGSSYGKGVPFVTQSFSRNNLEHWFREHPCTILEQEYWQFWDGKYWTVSKQFIPPKHVNANDKHQLTCILLRKDKAYNF